MMTWFWGQSRLETLVGRLVDLIAMMCCQPEQDQTVQTNRDAKESLGIAINRPGSFPETFYDQSNVHLGLGVKSA